MSYSGFEPLTKHLSSVHSTTELIAQKGQTKDEGKHSIGIEPIIFRLEI